MKAQIELPGGMLTFDQAMTDEQAEGARASFTYLLKTTTPAQLAKDCGWHWKELRK